MYSMQRGEMSYPYLRVYNGGMKCECHLVVTAAEGSL